MGQRVNIQYSVDLEDLETEVSAMIKRAGSRLEGYGEDLCLSVGLSSRGPCLTLRMLDEIVSFREKISKVDHTLEDVSNIISSYVHYKSQPEESIDANLSAEAIKEKMQQVQVPDMEELESFIEDFKSSPGANEVTD